MWIRNTAANHGNVFVDCSFERLEGRETVIARSPTNHGKNYPYSEAVLLNCALNGVSPEGWGPVGGDPTHVQYWEYNSTNLSDDQPVDVSQRSPVSRQLTPEKDAEIIASYSDPTYVLGGWTPQMAPLILELPAAVASAAGQSVVFKVKAAAVPAASYQWYKDGAPIPGAVGATLKIENVSAGDTAAYTVSVMNAAGCVTSRAADLMVKK